MASSTSIEKLSKVSDSIESAVKQCGIQAIKELPTFMQAAQMAQGISALREALTDEFMKSVIMPLRGTKLGFLTDRENQDKYPPYGIEVVRECVIEGMLRGFRVVGNEFNIISGGFYGTLNGYERKVAEYEGLTDLVLQAGVPHINAEKGGALVPYTASWRLRGQPMSIECHYTKTGENVVDNRIPIRVNNSMGVDAILGKARRKILFRIWQRLNGSAFGERDGEVGEEPIVTTGVLAPAQSAVPAGTPEGKRISLGGKGKQQTKGAGAPVAGAAPPSSAPAESAAPAPADRPKSEPHKEIDPEALHELLASIDPSWETRGLAKTVIAHWTHEQRAAAQKWATAVAMNASMAEQAARPAHTVLATRQREPGEDDE